jgi:hypothetical protein
MKRSDPVDHFLFSMLFATTIGMAPAASAEEPLSAMIPVEVLEVDPALATGELWRGTVKWSEPAVALQPARVARAIVTDKGGKSTILALALLGVPDRKADGTLNLDVAPDRQAWCELSRFGLAQVDCFQDIDSDGKLEMVRHAWLGNEEPLTLNRVEAAARATEPTAYRAARVDELPQFQIGYVSCAAGGTRAKPESEYRYSTIVRRVGGGIGTGSTPARCDQFAKLLETRAEGDYLYQFGRFKVEVRQQQERLTTRLIEGIAPGTLLGRLRTGQPLLDASEAPAKAAEAGGNKPSLYLVSPPVVSHNEVKAGEQFLSAEVAHGLTGKLMNEAKTVGWSKSVTLPAGTPLFGVVMTASGRPSSYDADIIWCAPGQNSKAKAISQCFARGQFGYELVDNRYPHVVEYLSVGSTRSVAVPVVERGPVDFGGPLTLSIRYAGADRKYVSMEWSVGPANTAVWREFGVRLDPQRTGHLLVGQTLILLRPSKDGKSATIEAKEVGEFTSEVDAAPIDAFALSQKQPQIE